MHPDRLEQPANGHSHGNGHIYRGERDARRLCLRRERHPILHRPAGADRGPYFVDEMLQRSDIRSDPSDGSFREGFDTFGQKWLRGYQVTDADGMAAFTTIYPGWYQGRTVHIHFKIRTDAAAESGLEFTSQLFFDDAISDQVFATEPYVQKGERTLRNDGDNIFNQSGGELRLQLSGDTQGGYATTFEIGIQA